MVTVWYAVWHIWRSQTNLKGRLRQPECVKLPIDKSAIMKAHLTEWISKTVIVMKGKKRDTDERGELGCPFSLLGIVPNSLQFGT